MNGSDPLYQMITFLTFSRYFGLRIKLPYMSIHKYMYIFIQIIHVLMKRSVNTYRHHLCDLAGLVMKFHCCHGNILLPGTDANAKSLGFNSYSALWQELGWSGLLMGVTWPLGWWGLAWLISPLLALCLESVKRDPRFMWHSPLFQSN